MESGDLRYAVRQCKNEECRFRYPAAGGQGIVCPVCQAETDSFPIPQVAHYKTAVSTPTPQHIEVLADNIRSIYNVGAIFRSADGAGVKHLHLGGITATPEHPKLAKTALGADSQLSWSYTRNGLDTAVSLKEKGYQLWALEETVEATSLFNMQIPSNTAPILLIIGNENMGIDSAILALCDQIIALPMQGIKESLNVSVAFGIAIYHLQFG